MQSLASINHKCRTLIFGLAGTVVLGTSIGCSSGTPDLHSARANVYQGRFDRAERALEELPLDHKDRVLFLMERGMIYQLEGKYKESTIDWLEAARLIEDLGYLSISRSSTSMLVNDSTLSFVGHPYERTLLRGFLAKSYLAQGLWDSAAVEARNIIKSLEQLDGYPDIAYARYMAGFGLELFGDPDGAAIEYTKANALTPEIEINPRTGQMAAKSEGDNKLPDPVPGQARPTELVIFFSSGHAPATGQGWTSDKPNTYSDYFDVVVDGKTLGRSYAFSDLNRLLNRTEKREAGRVLLKDVARIALKETIAQAVESQDELLGDLVRIILFSLEKPDQRYWGTLPRTLSVARVNSPEELKQFELIRRSATGSERSRHIVTSGIHKKGRLHIVVLRDITLPTVDKD